MVSSKFSQGLPPLRVPPVCKKKLPPGGEEQEGNPDPNPEIRFNYDVDITWWIYHWVFFDTLILTFDFQWTWSWPKENPADGERGYFMWFPTTKHFSAGLNHFEGGILRCVLTITDEPYPDLPSFDTEDFTMVSPPYVGKMEGRIFNFY